MKAPSMTPEARVALITGSNKGVGLALARRLALDYEKSTLSCNIADRCKDGSTVDIKLPLIIYLTARDESRGQQAVKTLHQDKELEGARVLKDKGGLVSVVFELLDVNYQRPIEVLAEKIRSRHGGLDILVNNAGALLSGTGMSFALYNSHSSPN